MIQKLDGVADVVAGQCLLVYHENHRQYNTQAGEMEDCGPAVYIDGILTLAELKQVVALAEKEANEFSN